MIPEDCASITITAHLHYFGKFACEVHGKAYALDNEPRLQTVTWVHSERSPDGTWIDTEYECHGPLTNAEKAICEALEKEAKTPLAMSRLHQAFVDHAYESSLSARGDHLRVVAAE
jgi:hypothetical protein